MSDNIHVHNVCGVISSSKEILRTSDNEGLRSYKTHGLETFVVHYSKNSDTVNLCASIF